MTAIRPPAVAGRFYDDDPVRLRTSIDEVVDPIEVGDEPLAAAYVVPHAGYRYSGPIAAHVYARLRAHAGRVGRVVVAGPSHRVALDGVAVSGADFWRTPLGDVRVRRVAGLPVSDAPHRDEHSIEVQLPFLQRCVGDVEVTPLAVGRCSVEEAAAAIEAATSGDSLLLCSTDLSHHLPREVAVARDERTAEAVEALRPRDIRPGDACGLFALRGALAWAARRGLACRRLDLRTSADTFGGPERVVGYPAFSFDRRLSADASQRFGRLSRD